MSTTCLLQVLGSVLGAEYSVCSRGYAAQDFFYVCEEKEKDERCRVVQFEQVHHVDGTACTKIVIKYIKHEFNLLTSLLNDWVTSVESG